jgi:hypothetical protein
MARLEVWLCLRVVVCLEVVDTPVGIVEAMGEADIRPVWVEVDTGADITPGIRVVEVDGGVRAEDGEAVSLNSHKVKPRLKCSLANLEVGLVWGIKGNFRRGACNDYT